MRLKPAEAERKNKKILKTCTDGEQDQNQQQDVAHDTLETNTLNGTQVPLAPGSDPSTEAQVKPLTIEQLVKRLSTLQQQQQQQQQQRGTTDATSSTPVTATDTVLSALTVLQPLLRNDDTEKQMKARLSKYYELSPRQCQAHLGTLAPIMMRNRLLKSLTDLRWPAKRHRPSINAEHYVVMWRGRPREGLQELHDACEELMAWADSEFSYTHVAITKNFIGSPHVDNLDTTYQYTISLGSFNTGGELCVESRDGVGGGGGGDGTRIEVISTHDRVASMDGRFVHWVRGHSGGDRYSLVFYSMDPTVATKAVSALREWKPTENRP
jgi:hypothetical protein